MISAQTTSAGRAQRAPIATSARALCALAGFIIVILVAAPSAQQPPPAFAAAPAPIMTGRDGSTNASSIELLVGRSTVVNHTSPIVRVSLTVPDIADAMVTSPSQLLVHGKQPGTISLFVWDRSGAITTYEVNVRRDLSALAEHLKQLFPGESISVMGSGKDVVVSGTVSSKYVIDKAADVAAGYVEKKDNVVNLLKQQEGTASNQVMLRVRFAEVSRTALTELGANFFTGPTGYKDWIARVTTSQFAAPNYSDMSRTADLGDNLVAADGKWSLSDFLNIFLFNNKYNIGTVIRAMQEKGLFQSLAEPNLIATNGKEASFLAGGEYPYPVVQPGGGTTAISIMFKEFGVRLRFTPTVLGGDLINLKVMPEVSALDFSNSITMQGYRVPALSTRRTETEVELRDGQTFAIAGLLNNTVTDTMRKIPGIGDVPILGWLFKSKAMAKNQTELVVMITPTIIRRGSMGVSEGLPAPVEPWLGAPAKRQPPSDPYVGSPRYPANQPKQPEDPAGAAQAPDAPVAPKPAANAPKPATETPKSKGTAKSNTPGHSPVILQQPVTPVQPVTATALPTPVQLPSSPYDPTPAPPKVPSPTAPGPVSPALMTPNAAPTPVSPVAIAPPPGPGPDAAPAPGQPKELTREEKKAAAAAEKARRDEEKRQAEEARAEEKRQAEAARAEEKRQAEEARIAAQQQAEQARKDEEERERTEKLQQERAKREAEVAKKNAEIARKKAEEDKKRDKAIAEAAERLRQAQAAYETELQKTKAEQQPSKPKDPGIR